MKTEPTTSGHGGPSGTMAFLWARRETRTVAEWSFERTGATFDLLEN
ncbi:MAG TPA: hypothetical protein VN044_04235 [Verrucomicrobiae bacterium]|nr:hypothetical protein [Verrucomicrobiae bacterium]